MRLNLTFDPSFKVKMLTPFLNGLKLIILPVDTLFSCFAKAMLVLGKRSSTFKLVLVKACKLPEMLIMLCKVKQTGIFFKYSAKKLHLFE